MTEPGGFGVRVGLVGPQGSLASDSAFGVALVTLWQRVAQSGVLDSGFGTDVERSAVATQAASAIDAVKKGWALAAAVTAGRTLVGCAMLRLGVGARGHTAELLPLLVDPDHRGAGHGSRLLEALRESSDSIDRWSAVTVAGSPVAEFLRARGFVAAGRLAGWWQEGSPRDAAVLTWTRGLPSS